MKTGAFILSGLFLFALTAGAQTTQDPPTAQKEASKQNAPAAAAPSSEKKIDPAKEKDIRQLLELTGTRDRMLQVMSEMEKGIKPLMENSLPPGDYRGKLIDAFFEKFHSKVDLEQLLNLTVPIYDSHFSHAEIKGLIEFYKTPLGKKSVSELPQLMGEMMAAGQKWGENAGRTSMMEVLAEHPEFEKAIEDAQRGAHP
jgi:hypothetical protein